MSTIEGFHILKMLYINKDLSKLAAYTIPRSYIYTTSIVGAILASYGMKLLLVYVYAY